VTIVVHGYQEVLATLSSGLPEGGGDMLSQDDRRRLEQLERELSREDPAFVARMSDRASPTEDIGHRWRLRVVLLICWLVWTTTVTLAIGGWWPAAVIAAALAVVVSVVAACMAAT
jgi:hypothetical protein